MIDALMNIDPTFQPLHSMDFMDANDYVYNSCPTPLLVKNHNLEHMVRDPPYQKNLICFYTIVQRCITPCVMVNARMQQKNQSYKTQNSNLLELQLVLVIVQVFFVGYTTIVLEMPMGATCIHFTFQCLCVGWVHVLKP